MTSTICLLQILMFRLSPNLCDYPDTDDRESRREHSCEQDSEHFPETAFQNTADADRETKVLSKRITTSIITKDELKHLIIGGVRLNTSCVLGRGSFGTVYKASYKAEHSADNRTECAAKQVDNYIQSHCSIEHRKRQNFLLECLQHSHLDHPNIVKMLGVFYGNEQATLPFLVMELLEYNLTQLLERTHNIIMYVKLSILQDVSRGLCYLHAQNPPIVHQALYSDNILITKGLTAKIGDFKTGAETVSEQVLLSVRPRNRRNNDFLPDSHDILEYDLPLNVFSFGCMVCHVITQQWPVHVTQCYPVVKPCSTKPEYFTIKVTQNDMLVNSVSVTKRQDTLASCTIDDWCVEKHQNYIDMIDDNSLKQLVKACLQQNPKNRPHISLIYERITSIMTGMVELMYLCKILMY